MRRRWGAACALGAAAALASEPINAIVAVVNDAPITRLEVAREAERLRRAQVPDAQADQRALNVLIDRALQLQRAKRAGIAVGEEILNRRMAEMPAELNLPDAAALRAAVQEGFLMTYDEFRARVREDMQMQALFYREVLLNTEVYEDEVDQFLKLEAGVAQQRTYRLRHILLSVAADGADLEAQQERAAALRAQAAEGADFAGLARAHSQGEAAAEGGNWGFKSERSLPDAFIAEVQNLAPGEVSEVIATAQGFHILKLEEVRGGELSEKVRRLRLAHVFLPLAAEAQAQNLAGEIAQGGEDAFAQAVRAHSIDEVSQTRGGEIGWFSEADVPEYFADAVREMAPGDVSAPIESPFGWHILRLMEDREERVDLARLREQARLILREQRAMAQRDVWLQGLHAEAHIRIIDPAFQYDGR